MNYKRFYCKQKSNLYSSDLKVRDRRSGEEIVKGLAKSTNSKNSTMSGVVRPTRQKNHDLHVLQLNKDRDARAALDRGSSRRGLAGADSIAASRLEKYEQKLVRAAHALNCVQKELVQTRLERDASREAWAELVRTTDKDREDWTAQMKKAKHNKNVHRSRHVKAEDDLETSKHKLAQVYKQHMASVVQIDTLRQANQAHVLQRQANAAAFQKMRLQNDELRRSSTNASDLVATDKPILPKQYQKTVAAPQYAIKKIIRPLDLPKSSFSTLRLPQPSVLSFEATSFAFEKATASVLPEKATASVLPEKAGASVLPEKAGAPCEHSSLPESVVPCEHRPLVRFANKFAWQKGKKRLQRYLHDSRCQDAMSYTSVALGVFDGESWHVCTCTVFALSCPVDTCTVKLNSIPVPVLCRCERGGRRFGCDGRYFGQENLRDGVPHVPVRNPRPGPWLWER